LRLVRAAPDAELLRVEEIRRIDVIDHDLTPVDVPF
jgi:hypothetical protein